MDTDTLQNTLTELVQSGSASNPAYATLLRDYATYHAVLVLEGGIVALLLVALSIYCWRHFARARANRSRAWTFETKAFLSSSLVTTLLAALMLLIVAANFSNVVNPQAGFAHAIPDLGTPPAGTHRAALHEAVNAWAQSGRAERPALLRDAVRARLAWQQPKAIACSIVFVALAVLTARLWRRLLDARAGAGAWSLRDRALLAAGVLAVPATFLLMIMALANTQASFAPITLTLLFG